AHPAPIMQAYLWVRTLGETMIREAGITATILRPWYARGPGRQWPKLILPLYKIAESFPGTRASAERLGLVTIEQFMTAMISAAENTPLRGRRPHLVRGRKRAGTRPAAHKRGRGDEARSSRERLIVVVEIKNIFAD